MRGLRDHAGLPDGKELQSAADACDEGGLNVQRRSLFGC